MNLIYRISLIGEDFSRTLKISDKRAGMAKLVDAVDSNSTDYKII